MHSLCEVEGGRRECGSPSLLSQATLISGCFRSARVEHLWLIKDSLTLALSNCSFFIN